MDFTDFEIDLNAKCSCGCMEGKRIHKIFRFDNGFGASVVATPRSAGFREGEFRILVIRFDSPRPDTSYCVEDEVIECADWNAVEADLSEISARAPRSG